MRPIALATVLAVLLAPQRQQPAATVDPMAVATKVQERLKAAKSLYLEAQSQGADGGPPLRFTVRALRPNYYQVIGERQSFYSDGKAAWQHFPLLGQFAPFHFETEGMSVPLAQGFEFFSPSPRFKPAYTRAERMTFQGRTTIALIQQPKEIPGLLLRTFIDPGTWLPVAHEQVLNGKSQVTAYHNVRTDQILSPEQFAWSPPKGAVDTRTLKQDGTKPLQTGEAAPRVQVKLLDGRTLSLAPVPTGKKALLVNFWFINCGYCLMELPELAALYQEAREHGLEMVAVNDVDTLAEVRQFLQTTRHSLPIAVDSSAQVASAFRVKDWGRPVTFLIGPDGRIAYTQIGYDPQNKLTEMRKALRTMGIGSPSK